MKAIPLADAPALRRPAQVTFLTRGALAAVAVAIGLAFLLGSRHPNSLTIVQLPAHADTLLVIDLSASIDSDTFSRIGGTLAAFSRSDARVGLVCFSDEAYQALPPGTAAVDLAPLVRYFTLLPQTRAGPASSYPRNPWQDTFSGGTRISAGMELAHEIAVSSRSRPTVVLVSDLEDAPGDLARLANVLLSLPPRPGAGADRRTRSVAVGHRLLSKSVGADRADSRRAHARPGGAARPHGLPLVTRRAGCGRRLGDRAPRAVDAEAFVGSRMIAVRTGLGALLAALAVLVALLAADVRSWPTALSSGDRVYAASPSRATWRPTTRLGALAQNLLGVRDALRLRRALELYRESASVPQRLDNALAVQKARTEARDALAATAGDSPQHASQALTLLGIMAAGDGSSQVDAALSDFTDAVRADPGNELAKYDLELLLRLTAAHGVRPDGGQRIQLRKVRPVRRRRRSSRERLLMTFLTPLAALVGLAALLPLAAGALGVARAASVRRALGLPAPARSAGVLERTLAAGAIARARPRRPRSQR